MEEASFSLSTVFTGRKRTICFYNAELEITNEKCLIRGHVTVLLERCPRSISL